MAEPIDIFILSKLYKVTPSEFLKTIREIEQEKSFYYFAHHLLRCYIFDYLLEKSPDLGKLHNQLQAEAAKAKNVNVDQCLDSLSYFVDNYSNLRGKVSCIYMEKHKRSYTFDTSPVKLLSYDIIGYPHFQCNINGKSKYYHINFAKGANKGTGLVNRNNRIKAHYHLLYHILNKKYSIGQDDFVFIDLPRNEEVKEKPNQTMIKSFGPLIETYLMIMDALKTRE